MTLTKVMRRALKGNMQVALVSSDDQALDPIAIRIPEAIRISGLSRSEIYRRAGRGQIILLKCGKSTLVEYHSLRATIASLPRAVIRGA